MPTRIFRFSRCSALKDGMRKICLALIYDMRVRRAGEPMRKKTSNSHTYRTIMLPVESRVCAKQPGQ
jgi:hypothetical protein